jgi:putative acetyltransferase
MMITIQIEKPNKKPITELIEKLDDYLISLYPPESNHLLDIKTLLQPDIIFLTAKDGHEYLGCGAIRIAKGQYAEIKRMYVSPGARGKGVGYTILCELQKIALQLGWKILRLETGTKQPQAIKLYEKFGFYKISAFGEYRPTGLNLFYEKRIAE